MKCKNCIFFYIESKENICKDSTNGEAKKYSCRKGLFSSYTESELKKWMDKRKFCYPKMESKISLSISVIALLITVFFPIWQTCEDKRNYIKKEDVNLIKPFIVNPDGENGTSVSDSIYLKINNVVLDVETLRWNTNKSFQDSVCIDIKTGNPHQNQEIRNQCI